MNFVINREQFIGPLNRVCKVIEAHPSIPLLSHCFVHSSNNQMTLTGSRIEVEVCETIDGVDVEEFDITFPANSVLQFCNRLPEESDLLFEMVSSDELLISLVGDSSNSRENSFKTKVLDPADFPRIEAAQWTDSFQIDRSDFSQLLKRTAFSMAKDQLRYYLNAMMFEIGEGRLRAVTTDAHRLSASEVKISDELENSHRAIVPRKSILDLMRLLPELVSSITIRLSSSHISVSTPHVQFVSKLLEGQYPDWRAVIPTNLTRTFEVNREELSTVFGRVNILTESDNLPVGTKMSVGGNNIKIHAANKLQQIDAKIPLEYDDEPFEFQVNCKYVIDIVQALADTEKIQFNYKNAESACLLKSPDDEFTTYLVMLMRS